EQLPMTVRKQAVNYMTWMCKAKPKLVLKYKFVEHFLHLCVTLLMESKDIEERSFDDNGENVDFVTATGIACDLLDEIFLNIPSETCFPLAIQAIEKLRTDENPSKRKSAFVIMAMMAEGCNLTISKGQTLSKLLHIAIKGIKDNDTYCRKCAFEALSQLCTHVADDMTKYHKMLLPEIFKAVECPNEDIRVIDKALNTIELFIDCFDDHIAKSDIDFKIEHYLDSIMATIVSWSI
ncbi:karyopherin beta, partial [Reticulomyxa filosa]